ncbi:MAG: UDP-N-acetylmuramoyl-L-alanine--D-glutamate ligase [Gemmatimonadales bacterium]
MIDRWLRDGREVAVIGLGRSGVAATRLLRARGVPVYASDSGPGLDPAQVEQLRAAGAAVDVGGHDLARIAKAQVVVVSPGVPPEAPPLNAAARAQVPIVAEAGLGLAELPHVHTICMTGTNGKTTTTALVAHLLTVVGKRAEAAGNIGRPVCEVALEESPPDWLAVELSSFQLHDMPQLRPTIGVLTNLAPDHLDRYARLEDYYADKARLFRNAGPGSVWIINGDDPAVLGMVSGVAGTVLRFSLIHPADAWFDRGAGRLMLHDVAILPRAELPLLGDHNVANALVAALATVQAGGALDKIAVGLRSFRALPHRMEPIREVGGVLWINDSKATNIASTDVAVRAMTRPFVLLLGGRHKGEPYTRLADGFDGRCRAVIAFGESGALVEEDLRGRVPVLRGGDFADVLAQARGLAQPGDAVLLSPACSSYDMFKNYEERGARFRAAVEAM